MHTLNRISSDDHYYLSPSEQRKATEMLMRASEQGELDYALGRLIQWGARKFGHNLNDQRKKQIDDIAKAVIPAAGKVATSLTGKSGYKSAGDFIGDNYDRIEPLYDGLKAGVSRLRKLWSSELDFESADQIVKAVDKTLATVGRSPSIRSPRQVEQIFSRALNTESDSQGTWYRLRSGQVVLKGAGQ
jgi:hypothetical protein